LKNVSKRFTSHHRKYSIFFSYILYLSFLITAHVIMSRNHTILPICYIRICNKNAFYSEFRFTKFSVILEGKCRWVQKAFKSRIPKMIFSFEGDQVMEKFVISKQNHLIPSNTNTSFIYEKFVVVFDGTTTIRFQCTNTTGCPL